MHHSSGRAYTTPSGQRTVPWYHLPTPLGVPKVDPTQCLSSYTVPLPDGSIYRPTITCGYMPPGSTMPPFTAWGLFFFGQGGTP
jgi:hypothetical protein